MVPLEGHGNRLTECVKRNRSSNFKRSACNVAQMIMKQGIKDQKPTYIVITVCYVLGRAPYHLHAIERQKLGLDT